MDLHNQQWRTDDALSAHEVLIHHLDVWAPDEVRSDEEFRLRKNTDGRRLALVKEGRKEATVTMTA